MQFRSGSTSSAEGKGKAMIELSRTMKRLRGSATMRKASLRLRRSEGSALVEMALSCAVILSIFFGVIQFGYALYSMQYVNEIARDLTRYAIVRGSASCTFSMPNCSFTDTGSTLQAYAQQAYRYPGFNPNLLTVTATWYSPVMTGGQVTSWTECGSGVGCNKPGYLVKVAVQYPFPLSIPFWKATTLNSHASSSLVISQ